MLLFVRHQTRKMFHVVLAPQKALSEDLLKKVAALVGKEIYDTRLLLSGEIPKIIASCQERGAADSIGRAPVLSSST